MAAEQSDTATDAQASTDATRYVINYDDFGTDSPHGKEHHVVTTRDLATDHFAATAALEDAPEVEGPVAVNFATPAGDDA